MKEYVNHIRDGAKPFSENEIRAAAKLYDMPIIVYSSALIKGSFFKVFGPMTYSGQQKSPLYLLHSTNDHFNVLIHPSQSKLLASYEEQRKLNEEA